MREGLMSRSLRALLSVGLLSVLVAACADGAVEGPDHNMKSAGRLPESRLPYGIWGDSPAPTGFLPRDKELEKGWYKLSKSPTEKPPSAGDRASTDW
jgi:hypothetical protein